MGLIPEVTPHDVHNTALLENVHPPNWKNPEPAPSYNLVVIGAGTAGLVSAAGTAGLGGKVALIEQHLMGGDCLNIGCVPSKTVIRSSRVCADIYTAEEFGIQVLKDCLQVDFPKVMERMRRLRARISEHDSAKRFSELGADVFLGQGRFTGPGTVEVDGKKLRFKKAVIASGARAAVPPIPGLVEAGYLTNETVFNLTERPGRFLVIGGGPLGCELAQAFSRLGCRVTIVQKVPQFLPKEDREAAQILADRFTREGIHVCLNTRIERVDRSGNEKLIRLRNDSGEFSVAVDEILVAAGRAPNVVGLNLEAAGVKYEPGKGVHVNDYLQTTNPHIYAAGDVCLPHKFTHTAEAAARIVVQNALFLGRKKVSTLIIPWCTYTDPEIAHVGLHEREAREKGIPIRTFFVPMADVDRAIADGEEEGFVKVQVKEGTDKILGATIVARHAGDMIGEISLAMAANIGLTTISGVIHPYPTQAEAIKRAADGYNRTRLTPFAKKLATRWLAWTR
ncbi:MAG TPA: mercuric reductase [Acidobacteriota bacterium]|jgi:pyruvate/2-oxoglutarate dehydrogenase complex dihydrolipoamide dehydrogenase (E3) component